MRFKYLSERLNGALRENQLTVEQFAALLRFRTEGIAKQWCEGKQMPRLEALPEIASVLGVDLAALLADWLVDSAPVFGPHIHQILASGDEDASRYLHA